ncbi:hypothetical protein JL720_10203 [Aureococcus anophagefferens]|nr:hypothetical protein JL720_10203 [Aureococcus anophagefferens]
MADARPLVGAGGRRRAAEVERDLPARGVRRRARRAASPTNLTVHGAPDEASADPETWAWTVVQQNDMGESSAVLQLGEYVGRFGSTSIVLVFHSVGSYVATARWLGDVSTHVAAEANLICRYVRRNVRALSESERTRYLDGFQTLLRVNGTAGRRSFGAGYTIDASLAVPYWDFTEDRSAASTLEDLFDPAKNDVWRTGRAPPPCAENAANASFEERAFFSRGMDRDYGSWLDDLNATGWARVLEVLCTTPWSPGEQVEAASPPTCRSGPSTRRSTG